MSGCFLLLGFRDFRFDLISSFFYFLEAENAVGNSENKLFSCYHEGVPGDWFCDIVVSHIHIRAPCDWFWAGGILTISQTFKVTLLRPHFSVVIFSFGEH